MFNTTDIAHMRSQGLDLSIYGVVQGNAMNIYSQVAAGNMPPKPNNWSPAWVTTFLNWITNGCPKGVNPPARAAAALMAVAASKAARIRKDVTSLSPTELVNLTKAFETIMNLGPGDPNSYFVQAGYHWLPGNNGVFYCQHHAPGYNPWHRAYLLSFENALRSVPGCEDVTLPYWDITTPFPDVLKSPPFDKYTLPQAVGPNFPAGTVTERHSYPTIQSNLIQYDVAADLNRALTKTDWEDFHGFWSNATANTIIAAHDGGHVSIGPTMADQNVAAFDPVFWFFHSNWDRLFWEWQQRMQATDLNGLLSTINQETDKLSYMIFTNSMFESLAPFTINPPKVNTLGIIDSANSLDVDYQDPQKAAKMSFQVKTQRAALASQKFVVNSDRVNVRVQGLNRLKIPGSFSVHLLKDGKVIASRAMFQPNEADKCENCVKNAIVHFDFELPLQAVSNGQLGIWVEPNDKSAFGDHFPHKMMGNPTVDVHFLLKTE